jgi:hypothetical protein
MTPGRAVPRTLDRCTNRCTVSTTEPYGIIRHGMRFGSACTPRPHVPRAPSTQYGAWAHCVLHVRVCEPELCGRGIRGVRRPRGARSV